jgi:muramoyltetrapeptide carboxypeptidase
MKHTIFNTQRRSFLKNGAALLGAALATPLLKSARPFNLDSATQTKTRALKTDDTIGLIAPASLVNPPDDVTLTREVFEALGFKVKIGQHVLDRWGDLAGKDRDRATDIHKFIKDPEVKALVCIRGGWGSQRLLTYLDYEMIAANPKIILGYSDITTLLNAIYAKTGLVTFHGPVGISTFSTYTIDYFEQVLMSDEQEVLFQNPPKGEKDLIETENRIVRINPGIAEGILIGGNLSLMAALIGTPYEPNYRDKLLFLEEVGEKTYAIDRMLAHLQQAGNLKKLRGIVIGKFTDCKPAEGYGAFSVEELLRQYLEPLKIPAYMGAMIGHVTDKWTVPIGIRARIDADRGQLRLLESAVI